MTLISDSIQNYKTVASFGNQELIVKRVNKSLTKSAIKGIIKANWAGMLFGFSSFF